MRTARNIDISKDENSILFAKKDSGDFQAVADAIRAAISGAPPAPPAASDPMARLENLTSLLHAGHITQQEFDSKKAEILREL